MPETIDASLYDFPKYYDLLFGSDWPMCLLATTYDGWLSTVRDWVSALSSHEQNRILGETAIEAYGL